MFASEACSAARALLKENYKVDHVFDSVEERSGEMCKNLSFYSAGFPCVTFSSLGKAEGLAAKEGRVALECLAFVLNYKPQTFLYENVASLPTRHESEFKGMLRTLASIKACTAESHQLSSLLSSSTHPSSAECLSGLCHRRYCS